MGIIGLRNGLCGMGLAGLFIVAQSARAEVFNWSQWSGDAENIRACSQFEPKFDLPLFSKISPIRASIINGIDTSDFPSVGMVMFEDLSSYCTGTFVGTRVLITAAHCISEHSPDANLRFVSGTQIAQSDFKEAYKNGASPQSVYFMGASRDSKSEDSDDGAADIAIVTFANDTAPAVSEIIGREVLDGEAAVIVGYGSNDINDDKDPFDGARKRLGNNIVRIDTGAKLSSRCRGLFMSGKSHTIGDGTGDRAIIGGGDSGGPMFVDGKLAGISIASGSDSSTRASSYSLDLRAPFVRQFIKRVRDAGVPIESGF